MDLRQSTQSQHGLGSWHPATRPNADKLDSFNVGTVGNTSLGVDLFREEIDQEHSSQKLTGTPNGSEPNLDEHFPQNSPGLNEVEPHPNGIFAPSLVDREIKKFDNQEGLAYGNQIGERHETAADGKATSPLAVDPYQDLQQDLQQDFHGFPQKVAKAGEGAQETFTESNHVQNVLGDREEMEKAWKSEERFAAPGQLDQTNSFPDVTALPQNNAIPPQPLPHSQVEDIMKADEGDKFLEGGASYNTVAANSTTAEKTQDPFGSVKNEEEDNLFDPQSVQATVSTVEAAEALRYEEGLLLIPSQREHSTTPQGRTSKVQGPDFGVLDDEDDFFDKVSRPQEDSASVPPPLDRKSTTQVLNSMHFPLHSANHAEPQYIDERSSPAHHTGSSIAKSQLFPEQRDDRSEPKPKEEDLDAMWRAALADDDLLEENENSLDPSSLFQDDGEGFLDGDENPEQLHHPDSTISPPSLRPDYVADESMQGFGKTSTERLSSQNRYLPPSASQPQQVTHQAQYAGQNGAPSSYQLQQSTSGLNAGLGNAIGQRPSTAHAPSPSRPQMPAATQSFADKSKGGYTSPYDLPMDVTRPKKRAIYQQMPPSSDMQTFSRPPPPRSSSMFTGAAPPIESQPPVPLLPSAQSQSPTGSATPASLKASHSTANFFEELPSSKPRSSSSLSRGIPPASRPTSPPAPPRPSQRDSARQSSLTQQPAPGLATISQQQYQLLPPERISLYGSATQAGPNSQVLPVTNARYSPAPPNPTHVPPPPNRYAASPSAGSRPQPPQALPFQPRTSSPLTQTHLLTSQNQQYPVAGPPLPRPQLSGIQDLSPQESLASSFPLPTHQSPQNGPRDTNQAEHESTRRAPGLSQLRETPLPLHAPLHAPLNSTPSYSSNTINTPEPDLLSSDGSSYLQQSYEPHADAPEASSQHPPRRSQTQSPGAGKYRPDLPVTMQNPYQRPASVNQHISRASTQTDPPAASQARPRGRTVSKNPNYVRPTDGRELDPLERWKGCPIVSFGFGGAIVTSFPKHIPRYAAGQNIPMMKCSPGEVKLQDGEMVPLDEDIATFLGPLKSKGKKKEVMDWLQNRILRLESGESMPTSSGMLPDPRKRHEEKTLLWKMVRVLVENDGVLDGSLSVEKAVRSILYPELSQGDNATIFFQSSSAPLLGISQRGDRNIQSREKPGAVENLRKILLHGEREKAVWHAVDNGLWAHAMLLASTLDKDIWKQVSQEFVRQEVKTLGDNTDSLAALYQIFAGNWEESVDELVPPSARAGLPMVSKTATAGPPKNALDGLDRWRETLTLILSNRSPDDREALVSLGQLLAGYGRTEAAHICYIFAKSPGLFGGADDPQVSVVLLGADHIQNPFDYGRDIDCILLTEVYDFARTVLTASSAATVSPHLQSYKLYHAMILAEYGYKIEAQQYCEAIASALKSTTKPSPYYHALLFGALDNLVDRLRQAPRDSSGSWITKPSIDKVSGSIWAKFNQYVAGDEADAASTGSGKVLDQDAGPFARVAGNSPTLSRTPSSGDLYSSYPAGIGINPSSHMASPANSRYVPAGLYTPGSSLEQTGPSSQECQITTQTDLLRPTIAHQHYQSPPTSSAGSYHEPYKSVSQTSNYPAHIESYLSTPPSQPEYMPVAPPEAISSSLHQQDPYRPTPSVEPQPIQEQNQQDPDSEANNRYEPPASDYYPPSSAYEPPSTGYEPPPLNCYETPSYNPDSAQRISSSPVEKPKKKSFMEDEDDDFETRAAALRREEKARKDREAEEAFRKAAEADAQKDQAPKLSSKKSSWLGGWFGGKAEGDAAQGTPNAPIKAKLGEESSFYYDAEKKRWVDKKNPDATLAATATPPPPKGPSRAVSAASGPSHPTSAATPPVPPLPTATATRPISLPKMPTSNGPTPNPACNHPSRSASPAVPPSTNDEPAGEGAHQVPRSVSGPPSGPPSAPPSRPGTGMSGASSIDDLIGAPQARKGGTVRKGKKGRGYVDVMAK